MTTRPPSELRTHWRKIVACFVGLAFAVGTIMTYTAGVFLPAIGREFGWSPVDLAWPLMCFYYATVPGSLACGALIDRFGPRVVIVISTILLAIGLATLSVVPPSLPLFCLAFAVIGITSIGTLPISYARVVTASFERQRGLALGIVLTGVGVGGAILPLAAGWLIEGQGWRTAYAALGAAEILIVLPIVLHFIRPTTAAPQARDAVRGGLNVLGEKPLISFQLALVSILSGLVLAGLVVNVVPITLSLGMSRATAGAAAAVLGLSIIVGRLGIGLLMDRYRASRMLGFFLLAPVVGALSLSTSPGVAVLLVSAALIGVAQGAEIDAVAFLVSRHYRPSHFGLVYGAMFALFTMGAANGPLLIATLRMQWGGYELALLPVALLAFVNALVALSMPPYAPDRTPPAG